MTDPLRVLLVEDSESDAKLVLRELRRGDRPVEVERVETADEMRAALAQPWDIVVSDWGLPRFSGRRAIETLRELGLDIPLIVVSGTIGEEAAVETLRAGAQDFVLKDRLARLPSAVEHAVLAREQRASRSRAERALAASEARFARLSESGIVGICFADVDGNVHDANDAYLRMLGYERDDVAAGRLRWTDMTPPEWRAGDELAAAQLAATGVARPWEKQLVRRDGSRVSVLVGVALLDAPNCIAFTADLTERKRAESALRASEEQFRQAQKMEAVGRLTGGIAHDFNNLISVIAGFADLAMKGLPANHPVRGALSEIEGAAHRAAALTGQLLAFSRRQASEPQVVDVNDVLRSIATMLQRLLGDDVLLRLVPGEGRHPVLTVPGRIEQVIMNLAVNARDAMAGGGRLVIETSSEEIPAGAAPGRDGLEPGPYVAISVTDDGCGMDAATLSRLFEPFYTTKASGTGLGLSTSQGIVRQCGGSISVESEPGRGTTFRIRLPRASQAGDSPAANPPEAAPPDVAHGTATILLAEDDAKLRGLLRRILAQKGYHVLDAGHGGEALELARLHPGPIDLLLTDVAMPVMNGRELADRLKTGRPQTRVLFMSGSSDADVARLGVPRVSEEFLRKPVTPEALLRKVAEMLRSPPAR